MRKFVCLAIAGLMVLPVMGVQANDSSSFSRPHQEDRHEAAEKSERVGEVEVIRDEYGVPHLYAKNKEDLYKAYGYVMAKDRLFQLEMFKRGNEGTASEIFGDEYFFRDQQSRRDGYTDAEVKDMIADLEPKTREIIEQFADGITMYIQEALQAPDEKLSKEFHDYNFSPEDWTAVDVVRVYMASMTYFMDSHQELTNAEILKALENEYGKEQAKKMFDDLIWENDPKAPTSIQDSKENAENNGTYSSMQEISSGVISAAEDVGKERKDFVESSEKLGLPLKIGSNAAIVSPDKSATDNAVLFSGPQVGFVAPGFLYEVGLHAPGFDMEGSGFIGYPFIMFGANNFFAFSSTAGYGNVTDIFEEQLNPENPHQYRYNGKWRDMEKRTETFYVQKDNGEKKKVEESFYRTVHGPVVSIDEENNVAYSKSYSFRGTETQSIEAFMKANWAKNIHQFEEAASQFTMSLNWYYADKRGNIGYYHVGKYPKRNDEIDPRFPTPGTGDYEWEGFLPFHENPQVVNPDSGYVVNWNNKPSKNWTNGELSFNWGQDNRVQQFIKGMETRDEVKLEDLNEINYTASFAQLRTHYFKPLLIETLENHEDEQEHYSYLKEELEKWNNLEEDVNKDGEYDAGIATFFNEWWELVHDKIFEDELGHMNELTKEITDHRYGATLAYKVLNEEETNVDWADKDPEQIILESADQAFDKMQQEKGSTVEDWRSSIRTMTFGEESLIGIPHGLGDETPIISMNRGSENHYIEMKPRAPQGYNVTPPGQIGFVKKDGTLSQHYNDQLELYENWEFKKYLFNRKDIKKAASTTEKIYVRPEN
ncbi:penicillin acylase family protein [Alteribacillus bidgolensis]|uniref:Penicillin amidase n=1 Tax=Alteribacillus bidgolensis TaxID=930129 RepID=A0A1G8K6K2_9BACI|nr:penicillin acylase family protein [Alteribacillus bidgolensis]SDI38430.1 penicillin amidase [Alteribacillus bidgolensis]